MTCQAPGCDEPSTDRDILCPTHVALYAEYLRRKAAAEADAEPSHVDEVVAAQDLSPEPAEPPEPPKPKPRRVPQRRPMSLDDIARVLSIGLVVITCAAGAWVLRDQRWTAPPRHMEAADPGLPMAMATPGASLEPASPLDHSFGFQHWKLESALAPGDRPQTTPISINGSVSLSRPAVVGAEKSHVDLIYWFDRLVALQVPAASDRYFKLFTDLYGPPNVDMVASPDAATPSIAPFDPLWTMHQPEHVAVWEGRDAYAIFWARGAGGNEHDQTEIAALTGRYSQFLREAAEFMGYEDAFTIVSKRYLAQCSERLHLGSRQPPSLAPALPAPERHLGQQEQQAGIARGR